MDRTEQDQKPHLKTEESGGPNTGTNNLAIIAQ